MALKQTAYFQFASKLAHFIEVKLADATPSFALRQLGATHPHAEAVQVVLNTRHSFDDQGVAIRTAARWLHSLAA